MGEGIAIGGNIFVDRLKKIDCYPTEGMLTPIRSESMSIGGCVTNTGISLKRLAPGLRVEAIGCVGDDQDGAFVRGAFEKNGLDTGGVVTLPGVPTGYTDVFATPQTRTFFVNTGANARFGPEHINLDALDVRMLHLGYALLLERMDSPDEESGTVLAGVLRQAQQRGLRTSIDVVSEDSDRYGRIVPAALRHCNYLIINEIEAGKTAGIPARNEDDTLAWERLPAICAALLDMGVSDCVILHSPETAIWMDSAKSWVGMRSLALPEGFIKGTVGAGDAFCAAALYGIYTRMAPEELLRLANCAAAGCLACEDGTAGVGAAEEMLSRYRQYAAEEELWQ